MRQEKLFCVYIMTNRWNAVLYVGVTSNLHKRIYEHKTKAAPCFTKKYNLDKLVWYEVCETAEQAITREKQLKAGSRARKIALIEKMNPAWRDLSDQI